jgi:hypothetical protein
VWERDGIYEAIETVTAFLSQGRNRMGRMCRLASVIRSGGLR